MRVLVTGCNGQVGQYINEILSKTDNVVLLAVNREELDIAIQDAVHKVVNDFKPTIIINAAAYTAVDRAETEVKLCYEINSDGPKYLAEAAQNIGATILHISTDYVFEGNKDGEYFETDVTKPQGIYGKSKLAGEIAVAKACQKHIIVRTAWVFSEHGNNFVKTMLRLATNHKELSVVGDQFGGPTYAKDLAKALIEIARRISDDKSVEYGVYHFSGLPHVSWHEFSCTIFEKAREQGLLSKTLQVNTITTLDYPTPAKRPANSRLNTHKINYNFGITASDWQMALNNLSYYKSE